MAQYIRIHPSDNVAVALHDLEQGFVAEFADGTKVCLRTAVPSGHKFSLCSLDGGDNVIKYGFPIGHVTEAKEEGSLIDHNCIKTNLEGLLNYEYRPSSAAWNPEVLPMRTFKGFKRASGQVGIRNQIWIIPTVGCVNGVASRLAELFREEIKGKEGSVDDVIAYTHNFGCSQLGEDHENTRKVLADMIHHPNAGGVLVVALGCENNQLGDFMQLVGDVDPERVKTIELQKVAGDELECGLAALRAVFEKCSKDKREEVPVSDLRVGLKCGGSDGLSGITANPLLGAFSDWIVSQGGTTVLTEVPEMFGAETILMDRCKDKDTFDKTVELINDFKDYFIKNNQPVYENPSPGNKAGGISTLEEKSLGCTQKSGDSPVMDVLKYADRLSSKGLNLLSAPGNDLVAATALASCGCQIVLFTTGRGTPFGTFVPTMKISTNTPLYENKPGWIDFNAGVLTEDKSMQEVLADFVDYVISVLDGVQVNNEKNAFHEISIFKTGVTL